MDKVKYTNAILFFAQNTQNLGKVKLNKLLYFLDFDNFEKTGQAVTGDVYLNKELGPVPMNIDSVLTDMVSANQIAIQPETVVDYVRYKITPLIVFDPNVFQPNEVAMLCEIVEKWGHLTAREIVLASHGEAPWLATNTGETIPYQLAYYRDKYENSQENPDIKESFALS